MEVNGRDVTGWSTADAIDAGVGMVHQHFMLVPTLTVAENMMLGRELHARDGQLDRARAEREVAELSRDDGPVVRARARSSPTCRSAKRSASRFSRRSTAARRFSFSTSPRRCCRRPRSTSCGPCCAQMRERGETIVLITHKLDEVMEISDSITVMRQGRTVDRLRTASTTPAEIAKAMVGRDVQLAMDYLAEQRRVGDGRGRRTSPAADARCSRCAISSSTTCAA